MRRAIAIGLKIPDNTAYTALVALRHLGIAVERVERNEIWFFDDDGDATALAGRVKADETIFNPNVHRLEVLDAPAPRPGEVWIEPLRRPSSLDSARDDTDSARDDTDSARDDTGSARDELRRRVVAVAWRLTDAGGLPVRSQVLEAAADRLLCNPAIERARV